MNCRHTQDRIRAIFFLTICLIMLVATWAAPAGAQCLGGKGGLLLPADQNPRAVLQAEGARLILRPCQGKTEPGAVEPSWMLVWDFSEKVTELVRLAAEPQAVAGAGFRFRLANGREGALFANFSSEGEARNVPLAWRGALPREISLIAPGVDRAVFPVLGRLAVRGLSEREQRLTLTDGLVALQDGSSQKGVWLLFGGEEMNLRARRGRIAWTTPAGANRTPEAVALLLGGFRGDSIIALEKARAFASAALRSKAAPAVSSTPGADSDPGDLRWFSDRGRAFAPLGADPREATFNFGFLVNQAGDTFEEFKMGADLDLASWGAKQSGFTSLTVRGVLASRFDLVSDSFDLLNTDFIGGLALGHQRGASQWEVFVYHQSSHLGDEISERGQRKRVDFGREVARFLYAREIGSWRFYAGPTLVLHSYPEKYGDKITLQAGAEKTMRLAGQPALLALDLQSRQEHDWALNTNLRFAVDLGDPARTKSRQFLFAEFFQGKSNLGQYWDDWESYLMLGIGYRFR